jgi:hypothetical protein
MKTRRFTWTASLTLTLVSTALASVLTFASAVHAQTASIAKIKDGDKIKMTYSRYDTRGREIYAASTDVFDTHVTVTATDKTYTWLTPLATTTYARETHATIERIAPDGKKDVVPEKEQFKWFPPAGDFSKLTSGEVGIRNQQCGAGVYKYTASSQSAKYKLMVAGQQQELDVQDVTLKGRWNFANCGSGDQVFRFVYSPQLDFMLERDVKSFLPNGFLSTGNVYKVTSVN